MALPTTYNLELYQGDDFELIVTLMDDAATPSPIDLTGYTPSAQIRASTDAVSPMATFTCAVTDAPNGVVTLTLPASESSNLTGNGVWDFQTASPAATPEVQTWLRGSVTVTKEVTR